MEQLKSNVQRFEKKSKKRIARRLALSLSMCDADT